MGLEDQGEFEVVDTFNDPREALSQFKPGFYNLLISDIKMPNLNGFEFYSKIRQLDDKIRVCFITGKPVGQCMKQYLLKGLRGTTASVDTDGNVTPQMAILPSGK